MITSRVVGVLEIIRRRMLFTFLKGSESIEKIIELDVKLILGIAFDWHSETYLPSNNLFKTRMSSR